MLEIYLHNFFSYRQLIDIIFEGVFNFIRKNTIHRYKAKVRIEFLFDPCFMFGMEVFHIKVAFADFVQFFDSPSGVIDIREHPCWIFVFA